MMEWGAVIAIFFGVLVVVFLTGIPVAFSFTLVTLVAMYFVMGSNAPFLLINSMYDSVTQFSLTPVPLFVLMGGLLFRSGLAHRALDAMEQWVGRVPGSLSVLALGGGAVFASLSGSTIANTAMLGSTLVPQMRERDYHTTMVVGPVMASGSLAMLIPPSSLMVVFGSLASISVGQLLIAGIFPGIVIALLFILYTVSLAWRKPAFAPVHPTTVTTFSERSKMLLRDVLPLGIVMLITIGSIFLGVATPTEAAALGASSSAGLVAVYGLLNVEVVKKATAEAVKVTAMILIIVAGSTGFSQVLAFTGASRGLLQAILDLPVSTGWIVFGMLAVVFFLGMFMEEISIMMITLPIFMPVVHALGVEPLWFGILMLVILQISLITPPVGLLLYIVKGLVPSDIDMYQIWRSAIPYVGCGLLGVLIIALFPALVGWLPDLMTR